MYFKDILHVVKKIDEVEVLETSPLLRADGESYFTFSPFQDTQSNFLSNVESKKLFLKFQKTIRKINTMDLTNPLNMIMQNTYAIQYYHSEYQGERIIALIDNVRNNFFRIYKIMKLKLLIHLF